MNTMKICSGCQKPLEANAPDGLCPECLLKAGLGTGVDLGPDSQAESGRTAFVAPSLEEVARLFPQLEILGFIGQGGMGVVYKARQKSLDRVVALKILPPGIGKDAAFAERFTREAKALARLNHTGIVTLYEFGQADGLFFFLMEFVDGMNLRHLLEVERISAREALAIVPQICDALQYAHDQGIVHRDIKPENILLDRQGRVKVADFGLAKLVGTEAGGSPHTPALSPGGGEGGPNLTDAGKVMGTPQYMAPEQREHPTEVDHRADIYSLGVVFYQMLTGELPGKPIEAPSHKVRIDVRLDEVVLRALEKEPARRYQQVSQVKTAVDTIAQPRSPADASPQPADWRTWSPFQSPQVREICAHMTEAERREVTLRGTLFGIWNAATFFLPCGIAFLAPKPLNWIFAPVVLLLGLAFYPLWQRIMREFLVSTVWARQQGITPGSLQMSPRIILVGRRRGQAAIHWPGVLLAFLLVLVLAEAGAILVSAVLTGAIQSWAVGIALFPAVVFMGMAVHRGRMTPVEKLTSLDEPSGTGPKPEGEKTGGTWDICAPDAPRWAHALLAAAAVLIPLGAYVGRGLLQGAKPTQDIPSQFAGIVILLAVGALALFLAWQASRYLQTLLRLGRMTPVEKLTSLDGPGGTPPSLACPPATRSRLRAALIVGILVWLFVAGTATLITWIRPESWRVVAIISCPHSRAGRPVSEHFKFTATMIELIRSDVLLGRVLDRLELDERSGKLDERWGKRNLGLQLTKAEAMVLLKRRLDVRSAGGTLIQVGVFGKRPEEPEEAMDIANTIAEELRAFRLEQHESPANMLEMTLGYTAPDILLGIAAGLVLGLLAGGLVLWRDFLRRGSQASPVKTAVEQLTPLDGPGGTALRPAGRKWPLPLVGLRNGERVIHWPGLLVFAGLIVAVAAAVPLMFYVLTPVKSSLGLVVGLVVGVILLTIKLQQAWTTPIEGLPRLDKPERSHAVGAWDLAAVGLVLLILAVVIVVWRLARESREAESVRRELQAHAERARLTGEQAGLAAVQSQFHARLPQGEIELVGVSYHPSTNQPWWRPDGSLCREGPFELRSRTSTTGESMTREFVIRLSGLPADASGPVWKLDRGSWAGSLVYVGGQPVPDLQGISATVPKSARAVTVKVGVGMGAWETVANQVPGGSGMTSVSHQGSNWVVSFPKAEGGPGGARILVTHTVKDWETRVLAVDKDGKEHSAPSSESSGTDAFTHIIAKFPDLPLERVKEFQFQVRSYEWAEFRDVMLRPKNPLAGTNHTTFGPVIETLIATADADDQGFVFFDTETGTSLKPPFALTFHPNQGPAFVELTPELKQWIKARDVDLLLYLGETNWDMMTLEMQERFATQASEWETISLEKVIGIFAKQDAEHLARDEVAASSFEHNYPDEGSVNSVWPPSSSSG